MRKYYIKQKAISFGDRYRIMDENQNVLYYCKGKVFSIGHQMDFIRASDESMIYHFQRRIFSFLPIYCMKDSSGIDVATVRKEFTFLKPKISVVSDKGEFNIEGTYWQHSFEIYQDGNSVASISKKFISWGDSYEISVFDTQNAEFLLALVILIDSIFHDNKANNH